MYRFSYRFLLFFILLIHPQLSFSSGLENAVEKICVRAAIDIGSGATKLRIAQIDTIKNKVQKIILDQAFTVPYQEHLEKSPDQTFDETVMQIGLNAIKKCKELSLQYEASKIIAIATESFRKAKNAKLFIKKVFDETSVPIHVIDQDLEGKLAFKAAAAQIESLDSQIIVWDIGGGSLQLISPSSPEQYITYLGHHASIPFKNDVIKNIQGRDPDQASSPNPMTEEEIFLARFKARKTAASVGEEFIKKISKNDTIIVGVGSIFNYRILPLVEKHSPFHRRELLQAVEKLEGKTDETLGGGDFVNVAVTNPILILGFMEMLDIEHMEILDVNNADGSFIHEAFWE